jgi:hypothetical protein
MAKRKDHPNVAFNERLVLFRYFLHLFGKKSLQSLGSRLNSIEFEGYDENQNTIFFSELETICKAAGAHTLINHDALRLYDENICRYVKQIGEKRGIFTLKYFQYISLLFTEMYLDRYFGDSDTFLADLNAYITELNDESLGLLTIPSYTPDTMNKLAFMCATGSGKTLIMHINILQFFHYYTKARRNNHSIKINKVILLSPNEGMSYQHLEEFKLSLIPASLFQKDLGLNFNADDVVVIDMNKLKQEGKVKTVSIDSFEQNNLVLVDEAHRGLQGDKWYDYRTRLSADGGFSFEYSATFKQALKSLNPAKNIDLLDEYGKSIIMDYSYKYFYGDGYGKEYRIYNLQEGIDKGEHRSLYLTGCLLSFYQQLKLYNVYHTQYAPYEVQNPLLIFVGNRVTTPVKSGILSEGEKELLTDIEEVLDFLDKFVNKKKKSIERLYKVLAGTTGIIDKKNTDIFSQDFTPLSDKTVFGAHLEAEAVYDDILRLVFNADAVSDSPRLHVVNLKQTQGEIGLKIGEDGEYFGVISIGDTSTLIKNCDRRNIIADNQEFQSDSLFRTINNPASSIKVLIGSRKFTEGWNCWRVSTMGLINFAKGEGSQAIQLFGRGVRLRGYEGCLKRSTKLDTPPGKAPKYLGFLETLTIFGIKADYMAEFKKFLELEELPPNEDSHTYSLTVYDRYNEIKDKHLKVIRVKDGINFKKQAARIIFDVPDDKFNAYLLKNKIILDCRAKVQNIDSPSMYKFDSPAASKEYSIKHADIPKLDFTWIFFELERYKNEKFYYNICLDKDKFQSIMETDGWYGLIIPPGELEINTMEKVSKATGYAAMVLQSYMDKLYKYRKEAWEAPYLEYQDLRSDDNNFVSEYTFTYNDESDTDIGSITLKQFVDDLRNLLENDRRLINRELKKFSDNLIAFDFPNHLYVPLIYKSGGLLQISISPVSLNENEMKFVYLLQDYLESNFRAFKNKDLYLLRNKSKVGMGFFEAGNFYPDYVLWINTPSTQYMTFIDPKGLHNLHLTDPKIQFYRTIKELEDRLQTKNQDKNIVLNSFIVTGTDYAALKNWWGKDKTELTSLNVLCLEHSDCIEAMVEKILN